MKVMKRIMAAMLCLVICLSMAGCYSQDKTWSVQDGDKQVAVGIYRYYALIAFDEAAALVPEDEEVLKATIEGIPAEEWIQNRAFDYVRCYLWVDDKIEELNLGLTEEEKESAASTTAYLEENTNATFEDNGISASSFTKAYGEYNTKFKKLFDYYYGEGGEREIPKEDLKEVYCADQYYYEYIYADTLKTDDTGAQTAITETEKQEIADTLEFYRKQVQTGASDMYSAGSALAISLTLGDVPYASGVTDFMYNDYSAEFVNNLTEMDDYEARVVDTGSQLMLLYKRSIEEAFESAYESSADRLNVMLELKSDEFTDYILEQAKADKADIVINDAAVKDFKLSKIVTDDMKMGLLDEDADEE